MIYVIDALMTAVILTGIVFVIETCGWYQSFIPWHTMKDDLLATFLAGFAYSWIIYSIFDISLIRVFI